MVLALGNGGGDAGLCTREVETRGSQMEGHPLLLIMFKASPCHMGLSIKKKGMNEKKEEREEREEEE